MIVIADSGSSKTDWLFVEGEQEISVQSPGINPFFQNSQEIYEKQNPLFSDESKQQTTEVYFYGAGCIKGKSDSIVTEALIKIFPHAQIFAEDDMMGAARAVLGNSKGIACILGTGSNSCFYDGEKITDKVPTLGFILGDEGSGNHMGKLFLNDYFKRAIPDDLKVKADKNLNLEMAGVLHEIYREEYPNRYLAGYSKFLFENINHNYVQNLVKRSFTEFFFRNIERYKDYKNVEVNFVGSIAFHYAGLLKEVAFDRGISIGKIIDKPIDGLKEFHQSETN